MIKLSHEMPSDGMMEKRLGMGAMDFSVFSGDGFEKRSFHNGETKSSTVEIESLPKEMQRFINRDFRPDPRNFCYLTVNALSDEETFGDNVNGDAMPSKTKHGDPCLINDTPTHGYKTYELFGHWYKNHKNKHPKHAQGFVLYSSYDVGKGIVIILTGIDRRKRPELCKKIDSGIMPLTSMGIKVPFDLCSKCCEDYGTRDFIENAIHEWYTDKSLQEKFEDPGKFCLWHNDLHKKKHGRNIRGLAKTTKEYCDHLKFSMGKMLPDGTKIYAVNHLPKCFDISDVIRNADKVSQGLFKVAGETRLSMFSGMDFDEEGSESGNAMHKAYASEFGFDETTNLYVSNGFLNKQAEIDKEVETKDKPKKISEKDIAALSRHAVADVVGSTGGIMHSMDAEAKKHPLPAEFMRESSGKDIGKSVDALRESRIIPTPSEFQELVFRSTNNHKGANAAKLSGLTFDDIDLGELGEAAKRNIEPKLNEMFITKKASSEMMDSLESVFAERTFHAPFYFGRARRELSKIGKENAMMSSFTQGIEDIKNKASGMIQSHSGISGHKRRAKEFSDKYDKDGSLSMLETFAVSSVLYPFVRNNIAKSIGLGGSIPHLTTNQAALIAASALVGDSLIDMLMPSDPKAGDMEKKASEIFYKEGGILDYAPWSNNKAKAHLGALATMPVIHGYSLHQKRKAMRGERLNEIERWIALNPDILSLGYLAAGPGIASSVKKKALGGFSKLGNLELRSIQNMKANLGGNLVRPEVPGVIDRRLPGLERKAPVQKKKKFGWDDRLVGATTWGLMSPGSFIPGFVAGLLDTELIHKIID